MDSIQTKTISELAGYQFFIPKYQRGYRWTEKEVSALLDDVYEFDPPVDGSGSPIERYCLQPLSVKRRGDREQIWEAVDGQQRLTAIFLLLKIVKDYLEQREESIPDIPF